MINQKQLFNIGETIKPHGISGEILCSFSVKIGEDNHPNYIIIEENGIFVPFFIQNIRGKAKHSAFVKLEGIDNEQSAKLLCNSDIYTDKELDTLSEDDDEIQLSFLIGFDIVDDKKGEVGTVADIDETTINTLFVLDNGTLIPAQEDFITNIDINTKIIHTDLPDGMLEL